MYFLTLAAFHQPRGINSDNHTKFPFISSIDGLFEPTDIPLNLNFSFPFKRITLDQSRFFYLSEINLINVFENTSTVNKILLENIKPIDEAYTKKLKEDFYSGYQNGFEKFYEELGQTFFSLGLTQQKEVLVNFIDYCHQMLYFEGFAIPEVIYDLGYIQANLVRAYKEYQNIKTLEESKPVPSIVNVYRKVEVPKKTENPDVSSSNEQKGNNSDNKKKQDSTVNTDSEKQEILSNELQIPEPPAVEVQEPIIDLQQKPGSNFPRLTLKYPFDEITELWFALLDTDLCKQLSVPQAFFEEKEVRELLISLFDADSTSSLFFEHRYFELSPNYQNLLSLLMHATYKLNEIYHKIALKHYCEILKRTFSPFQSTESVDDISKNITKYRDIVITALEKSTGNYAKKALQILKKIHSYRIK